MVNLVKTKVFLKCIWFHSTIHSTVYQTSIPKATSLQLYTTCHAPFNFIFWQKIYLEILNFTTLISNLKKIYIYGWKRQLLAIDMYRFKIVSLLISPQWLGRETSRLTASLSQYCHVVPMSFPRHILTWYFHGLPPICYLQVWQNKTNVTFTWQFVWFHYLAASFQVHMDSSYICEIYVWIRFDVEYVH